jgi:tetratricopeptide (TPR) repeat protein
MSVVVAVGATVLSLFQQTHSLAADAPAPEVASTGLYQEAENAYKASALAQRKGPVLSVPFYFYDQATSTIHDILRVGDEIVAVGSKAVATEAELKDALKPFVEGGEGAELPVLLKVVSIGEDGTRKDRVEKLKDVESIKKLIGQPYYGGADFFTDEKELVETDLLPALFPGPSETELQRQLALGSDAPLWECSLPAVVVLRQTKVHWDDFAMEGGPHAASDMVYAPGDIVCCRLWFSMGASQKYTLYRIHDGKLGITSWGSASNLAIALSDSLSISNRRSIPEAYGYGQKLDWCYPVRLGPRQMVILAYALRMKGLEDEASKMLASLVESFPNSKEGLALQAAKDASKADSQIARATEQVAAGKYKEAVATAEAVLANDANGPAGQAAKEFLEGLKKDAQARVERADKLLDAGDTAAAGRELGIALQITPDDPVAKDAQNRCECMELLGTAEKALTLEKWSQARDALKHVLNKSTDKALTQKAQAGLDSIRAEGAKRFEEVKKLRSDGRLADAKNKVNEVLIVTPDDSQVLQCQRDIEKDIQEKFEKSGLKAQWATAQNNLANLTKKYVAFSIVGKITDQDLDRKWLIIWGKALPVERTGTTPVGTLVEDGAIQVTSPNEKCISGNTYVYGEHYLTGKTTVKNAFGAEVPAWVYGPAPAELVKTQADVEKLRAQIQAIGIEPPPLAGC